MRALQKYAVLMLVSMIMGGILTTYLEEYEVMLLMPIRNLIVLGTWQSQSSDAIPVSRYSHGEGINPVHVALTVRDTALEILETTYETAYSGSSEANGLLAIADYFLETAEERCYGSREFLVWTYDFDYPPYQLSASWISGMAQGHAIEVVLAAYQLTKDERYLETARLAANAMAVPIQHGGVAIELGTGLWFEEYAQPGVPPPRVLNGHNFALNGLYYLSKVDRGYADLFEQGVIGLELLLPEFDKHVWSLYDLRGTPANSVYQRIHITQLRELYDRTGRELFASYARKFHLQMYIPFSAFYRLATYPNRFLVIVFFGNCGGVWLLGVVGLRVIRSREGLGQGRQGATADDEIRERV